MKPGSLALSRAERSVVQRRFPDMVQDYGYVPVGPYPVCRTGSLEPASFDRITVLPVGWLATRRRTDRKEKGAAPRVPFPVHIQALIGTVVVIWLFRLVGLAWLAMGLWQLTGAALLRFAR